jgi:hypothetical protein
MTSRVTISVLFLSLLAGLMVWLGCSGDRANGVYQADTASHGTASYYFPTSEGKVSTFAITKSGGSSSVETVKLGGLVPFKYGTARLWLAIRPDYSVDTDYVIVSGSSVVLYDNANSLPETILQTPLQAGQSWNRYPEQTVVDTTVDTTTLATELGGTDIITKGGDGGGGGGGNGTGKIVPTTGLNQARVDAIEEIVLSSGTHYTGALRVKTDNSGGTVNYYWFAPGYGLVRYVLGATPTLANGIQTGELIN